MENKTTKLYPTVPDADGFYFENPDNEDQGIQTKIHENGNKTKTVTLPVSKKRAVVRELLGKDTAIINRFMGKDTEKYIDAGITVATTIDGASQPIEYYGQLKMKDYTLLMVMWQELNF